MGERLTDEQLAELERLHGETPQGPWRPGRMDTESTDGSEENAPWKAVYHDEPDAPIHLGARLPVTVARGYGGRCRPVAAFIASARNALPSLLAEVRASRASPPPDPGVGRVERAEVERLLGEFAIAQRKDARSPSPAYAQRIKAARAALLDYVCGPKKEETDGR